MRNYEHYLTVAYVHCTGWARFVLDIKMETAFYR